MRRHQRHVVAIAAAIAVAGLGAGPERDDSEEWEEDCTGHAAAEHSLVELRLSVLLSSRIGDAHTRLLRLLLIGLLLAVLLLARRRWIVGLLSLTVVRHGDELCESNEILKVEKWYQYDGGNHGHIIGCLILFLDPAQPHAVIIGH